MYDQILFGLATVVSIVAALAIVAKLAKAGSAPKTLWALSFAILAVVTGAVAIYGLAALSLQFVNPLASLIPGFLAAGLLWAWNRRVGLYYLGYTLAAFGALLGVTLAANAPGVLFVAFVHLPSGLVIFLLPFYAVVTRKTRWSGALVGFGGLLIGVGGMALATLTAGVPILPADLVLSLLAPIFFAMALLFALGILSTPGWGREQ